jgi:excisionase family DNA binding protein
MKRKKTPARQKSAHPVSEDGLVALPLCIQNMTIQQVAAALGIRDEQVRNLIDKGELSAFQINDKPKVIRRHLRIARFSVLAFWYERLLSEGTDMPFPQSREVLLWRNSLRIARGLPALRGQVCSASATPLRTPSVQPPRDSI